MPSAAPKQSEKDALRDDDVFVSSLHATKKDWRAHEKLMRRRGLKDEARQARGVIKALKEMRAKTLQEILDRSGDPDPFIHVGDAAKRVIERIVPPDPSKKENDDDD